MYTRCLPLLAISLIVAVGCGGGGGPAGSTSGDQGGAFGPFQTRAQGGSPAVVTTSSGAATVTAVVGTAFTKITYAPTPSFANSRIAFVRTNPYGATDHSLNIANANGNNPRTVPGIYGVHDLPAWSRDGRIAVGRTNPGSGLNQIWVVNSDGSNARAITNSVYSDSEPSWSSDNFHVAFMRYNNVHQQIYSMTATGGSVTQLSDGSADDSRPCWSPDGTLIFFLRLNTTTAAHELWRMNANGTSPTLIYNPGPDIVRIIVSPFFNAVAVSLVSGTQTEIALVPYPISNSGGGAIANDPNMQYYANSWSPDGSKILALKQTGSTSELDTVGPDGNNKISIIGFNDETAGEGAWE